MTATRTLTLPTWMTPARIAVATLLLLLVALLGWRLSVMASDARRDAVTEAYGAARSATAIAHAMSRAGGRAGDAPLTLQERPVTLRHHFPTPDAAGLLSAAGIATGPEAALTAAGSGETLTVSAHGAPGGCAFTYTAASGDAAPAWSLDVSGC